MTDLLKDWVRDIFIIVTGLCFAEIVIPKGNMKKYLKFVFSIMILGVVLSPVSYFMEGGYTEEGLLEEYTDHVETFAMAAYEESDRGLEEVQSIQMEEIYKNKIESEVKAAVKGFYPELNIEEVDIFLDSSGSSQEKEPAYLQKIVIKGEETEYVNNIIRCVSQRLGIDDSMVSYEVSEEEHQNE
ncbi:MAG: hypothetical protein E7228_03835 [Clostridiales bacterium]|nr:hypothetical protein [Clostridiales bacterium]